MPFNENIESASTRILDFLNQKPNTNTWELKINLQVSSSLLYLALGRLTAQDKISIEQDGINYKVSKK